MCDLAYMHLPIYSSIYYMSDLSVLYSCLHAADDCQTHLEASESEIKPIPHVCMVLQKVFFFSLHYFSEFSGEDKDLKSLF